MLDIDVATQVRFVKSVRPAEGGCLLWAGGRGFSFGNRIVSPARFSWAMKHGDWPGTPLETSCGCKNCVAPAHLRLRCEDASKALSSTQLAAQAGVSASTIRARIARGLTGKDLIAPRHCCQRKEYTSQIR